MSALSDRFQVVAIDQRGYNLSDKPAGVESTTCACSSATSRRSSAISNAERATIVGHDWGGAVAWQFA